MIHVYQDKFFNPKTKKPGNSFNACLASMLEMPIRHIPPMETKPHQEAFQMLVDLLNDCGLSMDVCGDTAPKGYSIASGETEEGISHNVLCFDGVIIHNPHPLKLKLKKIRDYLSIRTIDEAYHGVQ